MSGACERWEQELVALLYEDLDDSDSARTRAHLAECAGCRAEYERLGSTRDLLSAWPNVANAPRIVYVPDADAASDGGGGWRGWPGGWRAGAFVAPLAAAATLLLALVGASVLLGVQVAPDGSVRLARLGEPGAPSDPVSTPVTREELQQGLANIVAALDETLEARDREERQLLVAAIDERMQEQGLQMSSELRGVVNTALTDMQEQHDGDLGLIFAAIDEMGMFTASELQRINTFLGSLAMAEPAY